MMSPTRTLAEPIDILSPSRPFSKSTVPAALEAPLEKSGQRISESIITFRAPQRLDLHVVPQHRFLGIRMQVDLLVHPVGHRMPVRVMLEQREGHEHPETGGNQRPDLTFPPKPGIWKSMQKENQLPINRLACVTRGDGALEESV